MHDPLRELATALEQPFKASKTRCRVEALAGERCDWHKADYWGSLRCGWGAVSTAVAFGTPEIKAAPGDPFRCSGCEWHGTARQLAQGEEGLECPVCGVPFEGVEVANPAVVELQAVLDKLTGSNGPVVPEDLKLLWEHRPGLIGEIADGLGTSSAGVVKLFHAGHLTWADVRNAVRWPFELPPGNSLTRFAAGSDPEPRR